MKSIKINDQVLTWKHKESLLDALERQEIDIASSCRAGACHSCLMRCVEGAIPAEAQAGLKEAWRQQGLFLACQCTEPRDMSLALPGEGLNSVAQLESRTRLGPDVVQLKLKTESGWNFRPGQFVNLSRSDGLTRSYSIASVPEDGFLELHVRVVENGAMSNHLSTANLGESFKIRGPQGDCYYIEGRPDQPLLLMGTGTGLAPLMGIARDALQRGHRGPIYLFHGGRHHSDLYRHAELLAMAAEHSNFIYVPSLTAAHQDESIRKGRLLQVVNEEIPSLRGFRVFLCGSPQMVADAKQAIYKAGVEIEDIYTDAFISAPSPKNHTSENSKARAASLPQAIGKEDKKVAPNIASGTWIQKARFSIQALTLAGFLTQGILFYQSSFHPLGSLLPFMAYDSLGQRVVSSTLVLWAITFILVAVFGRFVCGWTCPFGFIQDAGQKIFELLHIRLPKPIQQPRMARLLLTAMVLSQFIVLPVLAVPNQVWQLDWLFREPWLLGFPFRAGLFLLDLVAIIITLGFILPYFMGPRPYCKMVCETGYLMGLASKWSFGKIRRNAGFERDTCISCLKCTNICPQGIQVHEEVHLFDRVVNDNCVSCFQCVGTCPNNTIVYSLRKKVSDTGKVAGYLASLGSRTIDMPRFALTTLGVACGGWVGFKVLPPSYLHTYLLFASLGGLSGFLIWRLTGFLLGEKALAFQTSTLLSQVEKESKERVLPLSAAERIAATSNKNKMPKAIVASVALLVVIGISAIAAVIYRTPPRIIEVETLNKNRLVKNREQLILAVPQIGTPENTYKTYSQLPAYLNPDLSMPLAMATGKNYSAVALALVENRVDAAIVPAATAYAMLRRHPEQIACAGQFTLNGMPSYKGLLVARNDFHFDPKQLSNIKLGLTSIESLSGYYRPMAWFKENGVSIADFDQVTFAGTHTQALLLLNTHQVDIAATFDGGLANFEARTGQKDFQVLAEFPDLPQDVLLVRKEGNLDHFVKALASFSASKTNSDFKNQLAIGAGYDGFVATNSCGLDALSKWMN